MFNLDAAPRPPFRWLGGYPVAVLVLAAAIVNVMVLESSAPIATLMLAVIVSAWFGGTRPGLLAMFAVLPALVYALSPPGSWAIDGEQILRVPYFLGIAGFIVAIIASERRTSAALRRAHDALQIHNVELSESEERLHRLSRRLMEAHEEERRHFSRELHDEFGQLLFTINLHLHTAKNVAGDAAQPELDKSAALLQRAVEQVRGLALELRPTILETAGLAATLQWLASQYQEGTGLAVGVTGEIDEVPADVAIACFRIAQQALTNIVQHAQAREVWIELNQGEGSLEMVVRDDGRGFDVPTTLRTAPGEGHVGLLGMRERVELLGGGMHIDSTPGEGTRIAVSVPVPRLVSERATHATVA